MQTEDQHTDAKPRMAHIVLLLLSGCVLLLPWIDRCFAVLEAGGGQYTGPFVRNFERFGFFALKGLPLGPTLVDEPSLGIPYLNHPPAFFWLMYLFGSADWQMRLCTVLGQMLSSVLVYLLLVRRLGQMVALLTGFTFLVTPVLVFYSQVSFEPVVLPLGLLFMIAMDRLCNSELTARQRRAWNLVLLGVAFVGPWTDWAFSYYCLALVPLAWAKQRPWTTLRQLLPPGLCALASLVLLFVWRAHVSNFVADQGRSEFNVSISQMFESTVLIRPSLGPTLVQWAVRFSETFTLPFVLIALFGMVPLWKADRRLFLALAITGVMNLLLHPGHTFRGHHMFLAYTTSLLSTCVVLAILHGPISRLHSSVWHYVRAAAIALILVWPAWVSLSLIQNTSTTFFRDQGQLLSAATRPMGPNEQGRYLVGWGLNCGLRIMGQYVDTSDVIPIPVDSAEELLKELEKVKEGLGARYLWLRTETADGVRIWDDQDMERLFQSYEKVRLPKLEVPVDLDGRGGVIRVREAWLVTLRHPKS